MTFDERLKQQAMQGLDITERVLKGEEVAGIQARVAMGLISGELKHASNENGKITRVISLVKLGVTDVGARQRIAEAALAMLLPNVTFSQIGSGSTQPAALRSEEPATAA